MSLTCCVTLVKEFSRFCRIMNERLQELESPKKKSNKQYLPTYTSNVVQMLH